MPSRISAVLILGMSGMVAQIVLLRELLIVFSGNELYIGMFIGLWVAGEALGAALYERAPRSCIVPEFLFGSVTAGFVILFPVVIYLARIWKYLFDVPLGLSSGITMIAGISSMVLLPVAIVHGFLFICACQIVKERDTAGDQSVGITYTWETIGSIVGGTLTSFVFLSRLNSFEIAFLMALCNSIACTVLIARSSCANSRYTGFSVLVALFLGFFLLSGSGKQLHENSIATQWGGKNLISYRNSPYQNIVVVESAGQYTLFADGLPQVTLPVPDIEHAEELGHLPLLMHPEPHDVLVIGGGAGGLITEILKHPSVRRIDYIEPDPLLLKIVSDFPAGIRGDDLTDSKVSLIHNDGRVFLRKTGKKYDVVIMNISLPETLQANRFFTRQFFSSIQSVLRYGGILALPAKGSATYYSPELRLLNASLRATLQAVFEKVHVVTGDTNLYIAGGPDFSPPGISLMVNRQAERKIESRLLSPEHLSYRLSGEQQQWLSGTFAKSETGATNEDFFPKLLYQNLAYSSRVHDTTLSRMLGFADRVRFDYVAMGSVAVVLIPCLCIRNSRRSSLALAVAGTGMSSMIAELLFMAVFQVFYGSLFHLVGMLLALFMAGIGAGSYLASSAMIRRISDRRIMVLVEISMGSLLLLQALFLAVLEKDSFILMPLPGLLAGILFTGLLTGMTYPVASRLYRDAGGTGKGTEGSRTIKGAGLVYAVDLMGGCAGGLIGGMLFLPALGMQGSFYLLALIKGVTVLMFIRAWRAGPARPNNE